MKKVFANHSLFQRILWPMSLGLVLCWLLLGYVIIRTTEHEFREVMDAQMKHSAQVLTVQVHPTDYKLKFQNSEKNEEDEDYYIHYLVWDQNQKILLNEKRGQDLPLVHLPTGFHEIESEGFEKYQVYVYHNPQTQISAMAGFPNQLQKKILFEIIEDFFPMWFLTMLILIILLFIVAQWVLAPISDLALQISQRDPEHLNHFDFLVPAEMIPVQKELNRLLQKIQQGLEKEKRFTADASHELKTPLTALRVQTEVLMMDLVGEAQQSRGNKMMLAIDRISRLIEQLMLLAKSDQYEIQQLKIHCDWDEISKNAIAELKSDADSKKIHIQFIHEADFFIEGVSELLTVLARNLIENAIRYSPEGSIIQLKIAQNELSIQDQGPGIPSEQLAFVKQRFYRANPHQESGSGLGLSIVDRVAELHDLKIDFQNQQPGLKVIISKNK